MQLSVRDKLLISVFHREHTVVISHDIGCDLVKYSHALVLISALHHLPHR